MSNEVGALRPEARPYPMIPAHLALSWYLDSEHTALVVMGARILDWCAFHAHQIDDAEYLRRLAKSADEIRRERDGYHDQEKKLSA